MPTAMVTGATSGIGAGFARRLADDGHRLVLVARGRSRLEAVAEELTGAFGVAVEVLPADLSDAGQRQVVEDRLRADENPVDLLVNNAGKAVTGDFWECGRDDILEQLELNVTAVLTLTHAALPGMIRRGHGGVVNLASVAALLPGRESTYSASKAYLVALTEGLATSLAGTGVRILASCPGFVRTEFHDSADLSMDGVGNWMYIPVEDVVDDALRGLARNAVVTVPSLKYKLIVGLSQTLPRRAARAVNSRTGGAQDRT